MKRGESEFRNTRQILQLSIESAPIVMFVLVDY